ncbi:hypothetical protein PMIN02_009818 [Paraphaeosphaeria minitans]
MATIFCCSFFTPYRPRPLDHDGKFTKFTRWSTSQRTSAVLDDNPSSLVNTAPYAVQLVRQINFGPQEAVRYFVPTTGDEFVETTEDSLIEANFEKLNSFKNFRCSSHDKFFEVNLYQKNPSNTHHWQSNLARPSQEIDLVFRRQKVITHPKIENESSPIKEEIERNVTVPDGSASDSKPQGSLPQIEDVSRDVLTRALRFVLPKFGQIPGSDSLTSLLCLEIISTKLNLNLNFDELWKVEINSSKVIRFLVDCIEADFDRKIRKETLTRVEAFVVSAICRTDREETANGRIRLQKIVERVLDSGCQLDWISLHRASIFRVFVSGPSEKFLDLCRRNDGDYMRARPCEDSGGTAADKLKRFHKPSQPHVQLSRYLGDSDEFDASDQYGLAFDYGRAESDYEPMKDLTACDKECGYCGECDY